MMISQGTQGSFALLCDYSALHGHLGREGGLTELQSLTGTEPAMQKTWGLVYTLSRL